MSCASEVVVVPEVEHEGLVLRAEGPELVAAGTPSEPSSLPAPWLPERSSPSWLVQVAAEELLQRPTRPTATRGWRTAGPLVSEFRAVPSSSRRRAGSSERAGRSVAMPRLAPVDVVLSTAETVEQEARVWPEPTEGPAERLLVEELVVVVSLHRTPAPLPVALEAASRTRLVRRPPRDLRSVVVLGPLETVPTASTVLVPRVVAAAETMPVVATLQGRPATTVLVGLVRVRERTGQRAKRAATEQADTSV